MEPHRQRRRLQHRRGRAARRIVEALLVADDAVEPERHALVAIVVHHLGGRLQTHVHVPVAPRVTRRAEERIGIDRGLQVVEQCRARRMKGLKHFRSLRWRRLRRRRQRGAAHVQHASVGQLPRRQLAGRDHRPDDRVDQVRGVLVAAWWQPARHDPVGRIACEGIPLQVRADRGAHMRHSFRLVIVGHAISEIAFVGNGGG
jgi:hypothetical protein